MRRALALGVALAMAAAAGGCSLVWRPDRDAIAPDMDGGPEDGGDGGMDGGVDGGEGGVDAGDAGDGGMCAAFEDDTAGECTGGMDEDCDGQIDCFDPDCAASTACCGSSVAWPPSGVDFGYTVWTPIPGPDAATDIVRDGAGNQVTEFGPPNRPRALLFEGGCVPIALGLDLNVTFQINSRCTSCTDFAAVALTPADAMTDGQRLTSDLEVVVTAQGETYVAYVVDGVEYEIAGSRRSGLAMGTVQVDAELRPDTDSAGRPVISVTVDVSQGGGFSERLVTKEPLLLQEQLLGAGFCPAFGGVEGLLIALEGQGRDVDVVTRVEAFQLECSNPSFFEPLAVGGFETELTECNPSQLGEPSLATYCVSCPSGRFWELWVDSTDTERVDLLGGDPDFFVCGARSSFLSSAWTARTDNMPPLDPDPPVLPAPSGLSVREPYVFSYGDYGTRSDLLVAWAQRSAAGSDVHELWVGRVRATSADDPVVGQRILSVADVPTPGCESLRDPALVARGPEPWDDGFYLLFTCEGVGTAPNSIGVAALRWPGGGAPLALEAGSVLTDVLTKDIGPYALLGPSAPEPIAEFDTTTMRMRLRLWFLARSGGGEVTLGYASGEGPLVDGVAEALPTLSAYAANPILTADDPVLGASPACTHGCSFNGVGVAATDDYFDLAVGRTVLAPGANTHQIVGLRQRRPSP